MRLLKGLLAVPFVLHSQPTAAWEEDVVPSTAVAKMARTAHGRYVEIMRDVEELINDHSKQPFPSFFLQIPYYFEFHSSLLILLSLRTIFAVSPALIMVSVQSPTKPAAQLRALSSSSWSPPSAHSSHPFSSPRPSPIRTNGGVSAPAALSPLRSTTSASR